MEELLFNHVKAKLAAGDVVFYWSGTKPVSYIEQALFSRGIDVDRFRKNQDLKIVTYDEMFLTNGRLDLHKASSKLTEMVKEISETRNVRLVSESNWWLWADVFESGLQMEETHDKLPKNLSVICSYNVTDLLDYVRIYHMAKLMDLHKHSILKSSHRSVASNELALLMRNLALTSIQSLGLRLQCKERQLETLSLAGIIEQIVDKDDVAELEMVVESQLKRSLGIT